MPADPRTRAYVIAAAVFLLDRATKLAVESSVSFSQDVRIIPGLFSIVHSENRGVAFGVFDDAQWQWRTGLLIALSIAAVVWVSVALWRSKRMERLVSWAFALILGGAAGNLFDRAVSGRVTDFLLFYIGSYQWPAFNVADSAIVIGCGMLLIDQLRPKRRTAHVS